MKGRAWLFFCFFGGMLLAAALAYAAPPLEETRYCGPPVRDAAGDIDRMLSVRAAFRRIHPCPSTGLLVGACPGWAVDHVIPLACGGCDAVSNMQWLPDQLKSARGGKDGFERKIYGGPVQGTSCTAPPLK